MKRRDFLRVSGIGVGAAAGLTLLGLTRKSAIAAPFGEFPEAIRSRMIPEEFRAKNVLEVFLYGGLSPWETLYLVDDYGKPTDPMYANQQYYTFGGTGGSSVNAALNACSFPIGTPIGEDFGVDALGMTVKLGPFAYLLRQRADVTARMRVICQKHTLEPHEAAIPYALTGKPLGTPTMAGLGAHVQRYFTDRPEPGRATPHSYVFSTGSFFAASDNILAATTTGNHPGRARPLRIRVDSGERLTELLGRPGVGTTTQRQQYDALLASYKGQYQQQLTWPGTPFQPVRSGRFADVENASVAVENSDAVAAVLEPSYFVPQSDSMCGDGNSINVPAMSLELARHLLTHPTQPARYCCVVDTGIIEVPAGGGYDTHQDNSHDQARSFKNVLTYLLGIINAPGENDPDKLNLDDTLIILNTEFGRTPTAQGNGRNHHPYGYATAMIGGPITSDKKGVVGAIGPDGRADSDFVTPGENRIAALLAMGIFPFSPEAFGVSDVQNVGTEVEGVDAVTSRVLGYSV